MSERLVQFDAVSKRFRKGQMHDSLRDLIPSFARRLVGRQQAPANDRHFWALRDVSFEVRAGEVLGIIGPNGAGKSTTLKVLNRIMQPTTGEVTVQGRIGALIEVSAGFHQDLTGRQNVFLQGAIMGMKTAEVQRKFDTIVEFSGVEDFIDTPVKRYSSGMNARLGFSIAAHLEPEVLIIDEVLAVGDYGFQQKAFGRIKEMARAGAPVVLVSHQLDRIAELCTKAIFLERGRVAAQGTAQECISAYIGVAKELARERQDHHVDIDFEQIVVEGSRVIHSGEQLTMTVNGTSRIERPKSSWFPALRVLRVDTGAQVYSTTGREFGIPLPKTGPFSYSVSMQMNVLPGLYRVQVLAFDTSDVTEISVGAQHDIEVLERGRFWGQSQLNVAWDVLSSAEPSMASGA